MGSNQYGERKGWEVLSHSSLRQKIYSGAWTRENGEFFLDPSLERQIKLQLNLLSVESSCEHTGGWILRGPHSQGAERCAETDNHINYDKCHIRGPLTMSVAEEQTRGMSLLPPTHA